MSKIAEKKALEEYTINEDNYWNKFKREGYIKGYNQAMQDFMEKAKNAISMISRHYVGEDYTFDQIWEEFKNYMQDE